jgi:hypothetical protein
VTLALRVVKHPQATNAYRVISDGIEVGSTACRPSHPRSATPPPKSKQTFAWSFPRKHWSPEFRTPNQVMYSRSTHAGNSNCAVPQRTELSVCVDINWHGVSPDRKILDAMEHRMFGHAERLQIPRDEMIPGPGEEYIIWQDERLLEKAQTYDEATRKGKGVKLRHPEAKVEIQYSGVTVEVK